MKEIKMNDAWKCRRCEQILERTDFYFRKNGHIISPCKRCSFILSREWIKKNPEKRKFQKKRDYNKIRDTDIHANRLRKTRQERPEIYTKINREWHERNKERVNESNRAGRRVRKAISDGLLTRPLSCSKCGRFDCRIEASHDDYTKPLEVEWLCCKCHRRKDYGNPKTTNEGMCGV